MTIKARLRRLEDLEAIRDLIAHYGPMADAGASEGIAALFMPDGSYTITGFTEAQGREAIGALLDTPSHRQLMRDGCAHLLGPVTIKLNGDHATATGHSVVFHHKGSEFVVFRVAANRWYLQRAKDGQWAVARRENALLDGSEAARQLFQPAS
ncbi:nuclear transport factor 2 family protein [Novosphingobium sp. KACC 22771]|uniref:nuclear transport factor 2 family protein n=1 Tax=Novosphingobium sp. KACC 22771 TaxID=3025670 RepID=UPI0023661E3F|nr:nuclear transport factor 2 family protein [Novosphingobium sp. KACC 22771]WDF74320.1 nuclear transport factor 2 family protein [Novosphingobium sp. KACC 22771]